MERTEKTFYLSLGDSHTNLPLDRFPPRLNFFEGFLAPCSSELFYLEFCNSCQTLLVNARSFIKVGFVLKDLIMFGRLRRF